VHSFSTVNVVDVKLTVCSIMYRPYLLYLPGILYSELKLLKLSGVVVMLLNGTWYCVITEKITYVCA